MTLLPIRLSYSYIKVVTELSHDYHRIIIDLSQEHYRNIRFITGTLQDYY